MFSDLVGSGRRSGLSRVGQGTRPNKKSVSFLSWNKGTRFADGLSCLKEATDVMAIKISKEAQRLAYFRGGTARSGALKEGVTERLEQRVVLPVQKASNRRKQIRMHPAQRDQSTSSNPRGIR